jgi:hypothetical protein
MQRAAGVWEGWRATEDEGEGKKESVIVFGAGEIVDGWRYRAIAR